MAVQGRVNFVGSIGEVSWAKEFAAVREHRRGKHSCACILCLYSQSCLSFSECLSAQVGEGHQDPAVEFE